MKFKAGDKLKYESSLVKVVEIKGLASPFGDVVHYGIVWDNLPPDVTFLNTDFVDRNFKLHREILFEETMS